MVEGEYRRAIASPGEVDDPRKRARCGSSSDSADAGQRERACRALLGNLGETGSLTVSQRYDRGQTIHRENEPAAALYVVNRRLGETRQQPLGR